MHTSIHTIMMPSIVQNVCPTQPLSALDSVLADLEKFQSSSSLSTQSPYVTSQGVDETKKIAETWNSLGLMRLHMQKDIQAAKDCHQEALKIIEGTKFRMELSVTLHDLGYCYERLNQQEEALKNYKLALRVLEEEHISKEHPRMIAVQRAVDRISRSC